MKPRPGIALVTVIVVLVLIEVMSAGMLAMATHSRMVVDARMRTARADAAALDAVQQVLESWEGGGFDTVAIGRIMRVATASPASMHVISSASVERLSPAMWLVRSESRVGDGQAYSLGASVAITRTLDGDLARSDAPTDSVALGGLSWAQAESIADRTLQGTVTLADSAGAYPLTYAPGDLTIAAGSIRGIVVAKGGVIIGSEAAFEGLIVAWGAVTLETGAVAIGAIRSVAGPVQGDVAGVFESDDVVREVLEASPARRRVVSEVRRFLPAFRSPERS